MVDTITRRKIDRVLTNAEESIKRLRARLDSDAADEKLFTELLYVLSRLANDVACYGADCLDLREKG